MYREKHDKQDLKRHDDQDDKLYLANPATCDPSYHCFLSITFIMPYTLEPRRLRKASKNTRKLFIAAEFCKYLKRKYFVGAPASKDLY